MILEELIQFDHRKLKAAKNPDEQLTLISDFFASLPPVSDEKLDFFIQLLKERRQEERPYTGSVPYILATAFIIAAFVAFFFSGGNGFTVAALSIFAGACAVILYISGHRKKDRYTRLIRIIEHYRSTKAGKTPD